MATLEELKASIAKAKAAVTAPTETTTGTTASVTEGEEIVRKSQASIEGTGKAGQTIREEF
jgi:hypothetical protein